MKIEKNIYVDGSLYKEEYANMKTLTLNDKEVFYRREYSDGGGEYTTLYMLDGQKPEKKWSWSRFRYVETGRDIDNYVGVRNINYWIEDKRYTKSETRSSVERAVELISRAEEIKRGEIV